MTRTFADRVHAGRSLAGRLADRTWVNPIVLALPRGGVCVADPVAEAIGAPLDVIVARKLAAPSDPELAIGAVAEGGPRVTDAELRGAIDLRLEGLHDLEEAERRETARRVLRYRGGRPLPTLTNRDVLLVDDGVATGLTAVAAVMAIGRQQPRSVVLAVPVGAPSTIAHIRALFDEVVCLVQPDPFRAVGAWYDDFLPVSDQEVIRVLEERASARTSTSAQQTRRMLRRSAWRPSHEGSSRTS